MSSNNSDAIFWVGFILLIFSNISFYVFWERTNVDTTVVLFFLLLNLIAMSIILSSWAMMKKNNEKYLGAPGNDYNSAYLTGATPGGAVYVNNPDNYPGLGWVN